MPAIAAAALHYRMLTRVASRMRKQSSKARRDAVAADGHRLLFRFRVTLRLHRCNADAGVDAPGQMASISAGRDLQSCRTIAARTSPQTGLRHQCGRAADG